MKQTFITIVVLTFGFTDLCQFVWCQNNNFDNIFQNETLREQFYWASLAGNTPQLIRLRGFQPENHTVVTPDGYLIQIFRVVNQKRHNPDGSRHGYPLIIFQGLILTSEEFQDNSDGIFSPRTDSYTEFEYNFRRTLQFSCPPFTAPVVAGRSLPYTLATCGYDVWLVNVRDSGEYASHLWLNPDKDAEFWNVNLDSYTTDAKAIIDYVLKQSNSSSTGAICHSIGCNSIFQLMAEYTPYNDAIKPFFNLAPYVFTLNTGSLPMTLLGLVEPFTRNLLMSAPNFTRYHAYFADLVHRNPIVRIIWVLLYTLIGGINGNELDYERVYRKPAHFPNIAAARVLAHVGQRRVTSKLFKYDYGPQENMLRYGQPIPPIYDMGKVTNRYIVLFRGLNDILVDYADLQQLKQSLTVPLYREIVSQNSHSDFAYGQHCNVTVNLPILTILHQLKLNFN